MPPSHSSRRLPTVRAFLLWLVLACLLPADLDPIEAVLRAP